MLAPGGIVGNAGGPYSTFKGAVDVHIADAHDKTIGEFFYNITATISTLSVVANEQDKVITVVDSTGFLVSDHIDLLNGIVQESTHPQIIGISGNILSLDRPLDSSFIIGDSVTRLVSNMNVDGSIVPVSFKLSPHLGENWHILRFLISMTHASAADDSRFGNLNALTNGVLLRKYDGVADKYITYTNWKTNSDMALDMFDVVYGAKAGGGAFSTRGRYSVKVATEAVPKINQTSGDFLEILIQDNLTGLDTMAIKAQGHIEGG